MHGFCMWNRFGLFGVNIGGALFWYYGFVIREFYVLFSKLLRCAFVWKMKKIVKLYSLYLGISKNVQLTRKYTSYSVKDLHRRHQTTWSLVSFRSNFIFSFIFIIWSISGITRINIVIRIIVFVRMFVQGINQINEKFVIYETAFTFTVDLTIIVLDKFFDKGAVLILKKLWKFRQINYLEAFISDNRFHDFFFRISHLKSHLPCKGYYAKQFHLPPWNFAVVVPKNT